MQESLGGPVGKVCQWRGQGSSPQFGTIPRAAEQRSPQAATTEAPEPRLRNRGRPCSEEPEHCNQEQSSLTGTRESMCAAAKPKADINRFF